MNRQQSVLRLVLSIALTAGLATGSASISRAATAGAPPTDSPAAAAPAASEGATQVVVFDRVSRATTVVSHDQATRPGRLSSSRPSISTDGSFVAFESDAALVPDDANDVADVYVWDRASDRAQQISLGVNGGQANGASHDPSISGDGNVVAFSSAATNLTRDTGLAGKRQVFAWQRAVGGASLVSVGQKPGSGNSGSPSVSLDGRVVAFESDATNLIARDTNGVRDVFLRDLVRSATIRASIGSNGKQVAAESRRPSVAGNGGVVAFDSPSGAIVPRDSNRVRDVFVRDLPPAVQVAPNPLDFGVVPLGTPANRTVTVTSVGWTPVAMTSTSLSGANAGDFVVADDACSGQVLAYGLTCAVAVLHVPTATGPRSATLSIVDTALDSPQTVSLLAGIPAAQVRLDPAVGPPGVVTVITGSNFPPGALVTVRWDRGITQRLDPVVVAADGSFTFGVLLFHHDRLGPRQLIVSAAPGGASFSDQSAPFLVVPAPLQPPGTSGEIFTLPELRQIVIRR